MDDLAYTAVRESVAATRARHVRALRISGGDGAWETISALTSGELFLRDKQLVHTLWLDERAHPIFDAYVLRDDEAFVVVGEADAVDPVEHARAHLLGGAVLEDLAPTHEIVSLTGPFAWELLAELYGAEVVGLPYLGAFDQEAGWVIRAGKTGEYGYDLVLPKRAAEDVVRRLDAIGPSFGLAWAELDVLEQCMLENWFFNVRREGRGDVTPLELQLQWRATRQRAFVGSESLATRRAAGVARRLVTLVSESAMRLGDDVTLFGERVGVIANAGATKLGDVHVALAFVDRAWAHSGVDDFAIGGAPARSVTPPLPNNRSLFVNPQQHSYATRDEIAFPPLFDR